MWYTLCVLAGGVGTADRVRKRTEGGTTNQAEDSFPIHCGRPRVQWRRREGVEEVGFINKARLFRYLALVPAAAIGHTFACGNPLAFADVRGGDTVVDLGSGAGLDCILMASRLDGPNRILGFDMMWGVRPLIGLMARLGCHHVLRPAANRLVRGFSSIHLTAVKPCQSAHGYPWTSVGVLHSRERRA